MAEGHVLTDEEYNEFLRIRELMLDNANADHGNERLDDDLSFSPAWLIFFLSSSWTIHEK